MRMSVMSRTERILYITYTYDKVNDTENQLLFQTLPTLLYLDGKEMHHQFSEDFK
jgi:hypothetical protein